MKNALHWNISNRTLFLTGTGNSVFDQELFLIMVSSLFPHGGMGVDPLSFYYKDTQSIHGSKTLMA